MKILWVCNLILPEIAKDMGLPSLPKEGWVKGLLDAILDNNEGKNIRIALAFPVGMNTIENCNAENSKVISGKVELNSHPGAWLEYFGFYENTSCEWMYDEALEDEMKTVLRLEEPDIVHCFGTEFPHTLAMARAWNRPDRILVGIQGPCNVYAEKYTAHLPEKIIKRSTFRDRLKKDSILKQQRKYFLRGQNEAESLKLVGHIAGRTAFDRDLSEKWNPDAAYHHAGETLRKEFYSGCWTYEGSEKYRIFVSQADYPLKGFHYLLIAAGEILKEKSDLNIQIYVAGQSIVNYDTLLQKIKISSYGKYLRSLIKQYGLENRVHILGRLGAAQMKEQYLMCDTFVCCSECENSPNSLGEAMMLKVPIVTSQVGGITSVFAVGEDGWSYDYGDGDSLEYVASCLKETLLTRWGLTQNAGGDNKEQEVLKAEIDRRRNNAGRHAKQNHDPEKNAEEMMAIYKEMCS